MSVDQQHSSGGWQDERQKIDGHLRPAINVLASAVPPKVPPYHALIRIPNQAMADASVRQTLAVLVENRSGSVARKEAVGVRPSKIATDKRLTAKLDG